MKNSPARVAAGVTVAATIALWPVCGWTQGVASSPSPTTAASAEPQAVNPSLSHAAAKGVTLKLATTTLGMAVFTIGTGSLWAGSVLTALGTATSYVTYVTNEYLWDYYAPNRNISANNESFNTWGSLWRNSGKYITFKPAAALLHWAVIYLYTGSAASTVAMGSVYSITVPAIFYLNNVAWDWYDWYSHSTAAPAVPR